MYIPYCPLLTMHYNEWELMATFHTPMITPLTHWTFAWSKVALRGRDNPRVSEWVSELGHVHVGVRSDTQTDCDRLSVCDIEMRGEKQRLINRTRPFPVHSTGMSDRARPRLRKLAPHGQRKPGDGITQPRARSFAHPCSLYTTGCPAFTKFCRLFTILDWTELEKSSQVKNVPFWVFGGTGTVMIG